MNKERFENRNGALDICNVDEFLKQKEDYNIYSDLTDEELDELNLINECTNPND